jgi:hypothetical protein
LLCEPHQFQLRPDAELPINVLKVRVYGVGREIEPFRDLASPQPLSRETGDARLGHGQGIGILTPAPAAAPSRLEFVGGTAGDALAADRLGKLQCLRQ